MTKRSVLDDPAIRARYAKAARLRRQVEGQLRRAGISARDVAEIVDNTDWLKEADSS